MTSTSKNKELVRRFNKEFIEGKRLDVFNEIVSPDFINHNAPVGYQGAVDTIQFFEGILWRALADISIEILSQVAEDDKVVTQKILHAVHIGEFMDVPVSNKNVKIKIMDILRVADDKLIEHWGILDLHDLMQQVNS